MKTCTRCGLDKSLEEFSRKGERRRAQCKACGSKASADWNKSNPERYRVSHNQAQRKLNARTGRQRTLKYKYGLTQDDYDALVIAQDGLCAICRAPQESLCVDHCHETGEVRGLLCKLCNCGLGYFRDDPSALQAAIEYLRGA